MSQNGKLMPNLDQQSTKLLNLTVLQRIDPFIEQILITAAHVTFYEFDIDHSQWSRKDVEGSLFVVKRNTQPRFQFIVMNRRNTDNLVENLLGDFEYEVQVPYLLYRNAAQEVNGIWFYNARECEEVANLFSRILSAYSKVPQKLIPTRKSEFEALEAVPTMAVMDGPLEPSSSTVSNATEAPDDPSFVNFFSAALTMKNSSNTAISGEPFQSSATILAPPSCPVSAPSLIVQSLELPPARLPSSTPSHLLESAKSESSIIQPTNLVKPSLFFTPSSSAMLAPHDSSSNPTAPPLQPVVSLPRPYGTPMLQPFPPPAPPLSLTPSLPNLNYGSTINRDRVRDALQILVQDNQFIDMVYQALLNAHQS